MAVTLLKIGALVSQPWMTDAQVAKIQTQTPIDFIVEWLLDRIPSKRGSHMRTEPKSMGDRVLVLKAGTASGKSVNLAPAIYKKFECSIVVTEPRILTTVEITHDILKVHKMILGENIGYQTGSFKRKPSSPKSIRMVTIGVLLQQIVSMGIEWVKKSYDFIIIDEVHERDIYLDLTLFHLKRMLKEFWSDGACPMIVMMSATFNEKLFMDYFEVPANNYLEVSGFSYPIQTIWQQHDVQDYIARAVNIIRQLHSDTSDLKKAQKDILVFVRGASEIDELIDQVKKINTEDIVGKSGYIYPLGLNRSIFQAAGYKYQNIMMRAESLEVKLSDLTPAGNNTKVKPTRRVIIATNIAETGVTIDTLGYVIDTGYVTMVWYDHAFGAHVISKSVVTKFMANQRRGRVGRKSAGVWYPLYTEETYNMLAMDQQPKMVTDNFDEPLLNMMLADTLFEEEETPQRYSEDELFRIYLDASERFSLINSSEVPHILETKTKAGWYRIKTEKSWSPFDMDLMGTPSSDAIFNTMEKLFVLGFINESNQPTPLGYFANKIRKISIECRRMIFAGFMYNANILDLITISCFMNVGWREISTNQRTKASPINPLDTGSPKLTARVMWACEFIEYIWIWNEFTSQIDKLLESKLNVYEELQEWCTKNNLSLKGLLLVATLRDEQIANLIACDINPFYNGLQLERGTYNLTSIIKNDPALGMKEIRKIKSCIADGFRMNILRWDFRSNTYRSMYKHIPVEVESLLIRPVGVVNDDSRDYVRPNFIISGQINMTAERNSEMYKYSADTISVLDGFVDIDELIVLS